MIFKKTYLSFAIRVVITAVVVFSASYLFMVYAEWSGPTAQPALEDKPFPLNIGPDHQTKLGPLAVSGVIEADQGLITGLGPKDCDGESDRGLIWFDNEGNLVFCQKDINENYEWKPF